jgi:hypothetical protein
VTVVRTEDSEEASASLIRVTRIGRWLVTANVALSSPVLVTVMMEVLKSYQKSLLTGPHGVTSQKTASFNEDYIFDKQK